MKTMLIIFLSFITFSCKGQELKKVTLIQKKGYMYYIPNVNPSFETFNFQKDKEKYTKTDLIYSNNSGDYSGTSYNLELKTDNQTIIKYYGLLESGKIINPYEFIYYDNSPFMIQKTFYPNGNIKEKGLKIVKGNIYKGTWFYFDEKGKLINTINNDKLFGFSWEQIEKFIEENKIEMLLGNGYHGHNSINRWSPFLYPQSSETNSTQKVDRNLWSITYKGEGWNQYFEVVLDGDTGKILKRTKYWVSEEGEDVPEPIIEDFSK